MRAFVLAVLFGAIVAGCGGSGGDSQTSRQDSTADSGINVATGRETTVIEPTTVTAVSEPPPTIVAPEVSAVVTATSAPGATIASFSGSQPLPTKQTISADLDPHCDRMYDAVAKMALGPYLPYVAKAIGFDDGTDNKGGCEIYFDDAPAAGGHRDAAFSIAWTDTPMPHREPTNDPDEFELTLTSGATAMVDPTGDDGAGYDDVRAVSVLQPDGGLAFVLGFKGTSLETTIAVADEFDRVVKANS